MADNIIGIKFGVAGGKGFQAGSSGALIKEQLEYLASRIKLKVNINKTYFKNQLSSLKKELDKALGDLNINVRANVKPVGQGGGSSDGGTRQEAASYESVTRALERLYQTRAKLLKMPMSADGKYASVAGQKASKDVADLEAYYQKQLAELAKLKDADQDRINAIKEYRDLLEQAYQLERDAAQTAKSTQPRYASPIDLAKLGLKAQSLYTDNGFDKIIARSTEALALVDEYNRKVREALASPDGIIKPAELNKLNAEFLRTEEALKRIGAQTDTVGSKIREAFSSRFIQRIAQMLILQIIRALRQVYQNVADINKSMTELKIVTQATSDQIDKAADSITKAARKIGASVSDLINATTVYARLGYTLADAQILAEKTTMYANISGVNVNEATNNITGLIKAFNIGAEGLENVLDQLIYVGNNFPISQAEIGEAINNAGSALAANGNSLQQAIGILTAANASLQNVNKASTAVRTIAARISNSTAELEELGEDTGIYTTNVINAKMKELGVTISLANGQLRSTYDVLNDLAAKWGDLTDEQRASVANMLAGTRQQNAFYSIMNNWQEAKDVIAEESDGVGSLMEAQGTYIDSVEGRMQQLNATFESFSTNVLKSDLVKVIIQVLNGISTALDWISSWFPTTEVLVGAFSMIVLALGKHIITGIAGWITKLKEFKSTHDGVFKGLRANYQQAIQDINNTKAALADMNNVDPGSTLGQALATTGLQTKDLTTIYASCNKQAGTMMENLKATYNLTDDGAKAMVQWAAQSDQLTTQLNAASAAQARYMQALVGGIMSVAGIILSIANATGNDIVKLCASIIVAIGGIVTAIVVGIKTIDTAMKTNIIFAAISLALSAIMMMVQAIKALIPSYDNLKEKAKECKDAWKDAKEELDAVKDKIKEVQDAIDELNAKEVKSFVDQKDLEKLQQELEILKQEEAIKETETRAAQRDAMNAAEKALDKYKSENTIKDSDGNVIQTFDSRIGNALKDYRNSTEREWAQETLKQYGELLSGFEYGMNEKLDSYFDEYYQLLDMYTASTESTAAAWQSIVARLKNKDAIDALKAFADTYSDTSKITGEAIQQLAQQTPEVQELFEYLKTVGMWDGSSWDNLTELIGNLRTKLVELTAIDIIDDIEAITDKFDALNDALSDIAENGIISLGTLQTLMDKYPSLLNKYFNRNLDGYQLSGDYKDQSNYEILQDMAITSLTEYQKVLQDAKDTLAGLTQEDDDYETALKNLATAQDNLNMKEIEWASLLREAAIDDETKRLEKMQDTLEEQLDVYKELIDIRKDLLKTYEEEVNYQKELAKKQKTVADLQTQLSLAKLDKSAAGQARARELESQLQEAQEELDEYTLERAIQDITAALDNEYNEYEQFIQEQVELISTQIESIATTLNGILSGIEGLTNTQFTGSEMYELYTDLKAKQAAGMSVSGDAKTFMDKVAAGDYNGADKLYVSAKSAADSYKPPEPPKPQKSQDELLAEQMTKLKGAWGSGIKANNYGDNGEVVYNGKKYYIESGGDDGSLWNAAYKVNKYGDRDIFYYNGELYGCLDDSIVKLKQRAHSYKADSSEGYVALKKAVEAAGIYHTGGFVGDITSLKSNEEFAKLLNGEFVSTPKQMDMFMKKTLPKALSYGNSGGATINNNSPLVEIKCGDVDEDTMPKLRTLVDQAVIKIGKTMESALSRTGYKKKN